MDEKEKLSKIAEMLLGGGKMLGVHCTTCKSPLFQQHGKITCPICGEKSSVVKPKTKPASLTKVEGVLQAKLNSLAEQLAKETDHVKTLELLDSLKSTMEALEKLKEGRD